MSLRFGKSTYRPRHNYYTRNRRTHAPCAAERQSKPLLAAIETDIREAIDEGMQACYRDTGTYHPLTTTTYAYTSPISGSSITVSRTRAGTQYATMAQYYGPLGHWFCYIGWGQGTLFCMEPPPPTRS